MTLPDELTAQLDPVYAAWLEASNPPLPEGFQPTIEQMRQGFAQQVQISNGPLDESLERQEHTIAGREGHEIPVRLYRHREQDTANACIVYVHGGGWVLGNLDTHEGICADLATRTGQSVLSLNYRLSPEHHFPAAMHDTTDVLKALSENAEKYGIDNSRISIVGDSAGASLAVSACLQLRQNDALPNRLAIIYPALGADIDRPSFVENRDMPGLSPAMMRFFFVSYIGGETLPDPLAAPLVVEDLTGLPPVFISGAKLDPLRDDASDFAKRLQAADVPVELRIEASLGHGYLWVRRQSEAAAAAFTAAVNFLSQDKR